MVFLHVSVFTHSFKKRKRNSYHLPYLMLRAAAMVPSLAELSARGLSHLRTRLSRQPHDLNTWLKRIIGFAAMLFFAVL